MRILPDFDQFAVSLQMALVEQYHRGKGADDGDGGQGFNEAESVAGPEWWWLSWEDKG
jgi:hypothetical protein